MGRKGRLVGTVIAALVTARLGLHEWTDDYRMDRDWVVRCVAILAVLAILEPLSAVIRSRLQPLNDAELSILDSLMKAALVQVIDYCQGDYRRMGINVYVQRRTLLHPLGREQVKVCRLSLSASPAPSTIRWTRGKGFIGLVQTLQREISIDMRYYYGLLPPDCDEPTWLSQPDDVRLGLSYREFLQVRDYAVIVGAPIFSDGRYRGCVTMDAPDDYAGRAHHASVSRPLQVLANTVGAWL